MPLSVSVRLRLIFLFRKSCLGSALTQFCLSLKPANRKVLRLAS